MTTQAAEFAVCRMTEGTVERAPEVQWFCYHGRDKQTGRAGRAWKTGRGAPPVKLSEVEAHEIAGRQREAKVVRYDETPHAIKKRRKQ